MAFQPKTKITSIFTSIVEIFLIINFEVMIELFFSFLFFAEIFWLIQSWVRDETQRWVDN